MSNTKNVDSYEITEKLLSDTDDESSDEYKIGGKKENRRKRLLLSDEIMKNLKFSKNIKDIEDKVDVLYDAVKEIKNTIKKLKVSYQNDINKIYNSKQRRIARDTPVGFMIPMKFPDSLMKLIGEPVDNKLSIPEFTKKFYGVLSERGLTYDKNKRVLRVDDEIAKIFGLSKHVNKSTNHKDKFGFNFTTLQGLLSYVMENPLSPELASLINVAPGVKMNMPEFAKNFKKAMITQKLVYSKNNDVFRTNDELNKLFGLTDAVNNSVDQYDADGFNMYTLPYYIMSLNKKKPKATIKTTHINNPVTFASR